MICRINLIRPFRRRRFIRTPHRPLLLALIPQRLLVRVWVAILLRLALKQQRLPPLRTLRVLQPPRVLGRERSLHLAVVVSPVRLRGRCVLLMGRRFPHRGLPRSGKAVSVTLFLVVVLVGLVVRVLFLVARRFPVVRVLHVPVLQVRQAQLGRVVVQPVCGAWA